MIPKMLKKALSSPYYMVKLNKNLFLHITKQFSQFPKPSRFSEQLGLHHQFEKTKILAEKDQKSSIATSYIVIWGCLCVLGSFFGMIIFRKQLKDALRIRYQLIQLIIFSNGDQQYLKILQQVIEYENLHTGNTVFSNQMLSDVIDKCISNFKGYNKQDVQKYHSLVDVALKKNLGNSMNNKNNYLVYKKYLQKLLAGNTYRQSSSLNIVISFLIRYADTQMLYLISLLSLKNILSISQQQKIHIHQRLPQQKLQVQQMQATLAEIGKQEKLMIEPYQFQVNMKRKWIKFIQKHIILQ